MFFKNSKAIASPQKEEATWTREFWMYIGSLVLLISAIQITFTTSIPVWNKMFGLKLAPPADPIYHYNRIQIWIAVVLAVLIGITQFFKYKNTEIKKVVKDQIATLIITTIISLIIGFHQHINQIQAIFIMVTAVYAVIANIGYLIKIKVKEVTKWGASIAHFGFGLMLLGILLSSFNKHVISKNKLNIDLGLQGKTDQETHQENQQNILLFRNTPAEMSDYTLTYLGDSVVAPNHFYKIQYTKFDKQTNKQLEKFILYPLAQINPKMGLISSPDTRHYITHDVYTHITSVPDNSKDKQTLDSKDFSFHQVKAGDTIQGKDCKVVFKGIAENVERKDVALMKEDIAVSARFEVIGTNRTYPAEALYIIRNKTSLPIAGRVDDLGVQLFVNQIMPDKQLFDIAFGEHKPAPEYVVMKALDFPYINVLWMGVIVLVVGFSFSLVKRIRKNSQPSEA